MNISVIIPTYNEEKVIEDCLKSLGKQTYSDFEVILVDDGSLDETLNLVSKYKMNKYLLTILKQKHKGPGAARNKGAKIAKGKILIFVDADMTFDKDFLLKLIKPILTNETKGTFSKEEHVSNWRNMWSRCWNINEGWEPKMRHPANYPDEDKVFRAILKSEFIKVGGFTPGGYTDDYSLNNKLGYLSKAAPAAVFYHRNPDNLVEIFHHAKWVGKRKYKLKAIGYLVGLTRAALPISIITGLYKSLRYQLPHFVVFKLVYDFGVFVGLMEYVFGGNKLK